MKLSFDNWKLKYIYKGYIFANIYIRLFKVHSSIFNKNNSELSIIMDNSNSDLINSRFNGIYKIYGNILLKDNFEFILLDILIDLYKNNEFTVFKLHFLIKPDFNSSIIDWDKLNKHLSKYPTEFVNQNIFKFYQNVGKIGSLGIIVWFSLYDELNLINISKYIKHNY